MSTFDSVVGSARESFDLLTDTLDPRTFIEDFRRRRARYFDGRFLTARDLTREQQYTLIRQADLGQSGGGGIVSGLNVKSVNDARTLRIEKGYGVSPAGEVIRLTKRVQISVRNVPTIERLNATFGLEPLPGELTGKASGLFVLALRPIEFTDNPTIAYPVGLDDRRRLEEGEVVEATALIMIPFKKTGQDVIEKESRADLAREIFFDRGLRRLTGEALPLAIIALDRGNIAFVDEFLVRRNIGSTEVLTFGLGERSVREAFLLQYTKHLADVEQARRKSGHSEPFQATEFFRALPPFGPLPVDSIEIEGEQILQSFFPPDMNVEVTIIPQDELASLAEESLAFAPLDLKASDDALELTAVMICIPMDPELYAQKLAQFRSTKTTQLQQRINRPTARVMPIAALDALRRRRLRLPLVKPSPVDVAPWHDALKTAQHLYYVRRRQVPQVSFIVPRYPEIEGVDPTASSPWTTTVRQRLVDAGELIDPIASPEDADLLRRFDLLIRRTLDEGNTEVVEALHDFFNLDAFFITDPNVDRTEAMLLVNSAVAELAYRARTRLEDLVRAETFPETTLPGGVPPLSARLAEVRVRALRLEDIQALTPLYDETSEPTFGGGLRAMLDFDDAAADVHGSELNGLPERSMLAASLRVRNLDRFIRQTSPDFRTLIPLLLDFVRGASVDGMWRIAAGVEPLLLAGP